jgi:hypothetical protein
MQYHRRRAIDTAAASAAAAALSLSPPAALPPRSPRRLRHCRAAKLAATSVLLPPSSLR